jgi:membrane-bound lytic murein transglycosylase F
MKAKPEFFNDPVCKYGYFRGKETVRYVKDVMSLYERCKKDISS